MSQSAPKPRRLPILDQDGLHILPYRLKAVWWLALRPYLLWVVTLTLPQEQRQAVMSFFYPQSADFIRAAIIALPFVLLLAAFSQRVPQDKKLRRGRQATFWFALWRQGRWLCPLTLSADLYWTITHLPPYAALQAPGLLVLVVLLVLALWYTLMSKSLHQVFLEWPEPKMLAKSSANVAPNPSEKAKELGDSERQ